MADMLEAIKGIVKNTLDAYMPFSAYYGTVVQESPLTVQIDPKFYLTHEFLTVLRHVGPLEEGSRVFLLKVSDGEYVVMGKVVLPGEDYTG